jgi:hypothetical protein
MDTVSSIAGRVEQPTLGIKHLKDKYKEFLHTSFGKELLTSSLSQLRKWKVMVQGKAYVFSTCGVQGRHIDKQLWGKMTKIPITPIGLPLQCHFNAKFFCDEKMNITIQKGFNVTACPCGRLMGFEYHSVNKVDGQFYDFTKDFNSETSKYFLEAYETMPNPKDGFHINKGCKCPIKWGMLSSPISEPELIKLITPPKSTPPCCY